MELCIPKNAQWIIDTLEGAGYEAYAVGGCVRDALRGAIPHDWDVCTSAPPPVTRDLFLPLARTVVETGLKHGTVTVVCTGPDGGPENYEVTTFRTESAYSDHRHPDSVAFTASLEEDLSRRDFTVNAMAYSPKRGLVDLFGGREDLQAGIIRCVGDPCARFKEDALRILRALRFASALDADVEEETGRALRLMSPDLLLCSKERQYAELTKLLLGSGAKRVLLNWREVVAVVIPQLRPLFDYDQNSPWHAYDLWRHTVMTVDAVPADPVLRWAALLHDLGKPDACIMGEDGRNHYPGHPERGAELAGEILRSLRADTETVRAVRTLILHHDDRGYSRRSVRRSLGELGPEMYLRLLRLQLADSRAQGTVRSRAKEADVLLAEETARDILAKSECLTVKDLALNGTDLLALGWKRGPELGAVLAGLLDRVLEDPSLNTRERLLALLAQEKQ